jgi:hypothetical protein
MLKAIQILARTLHGNRRRLLAEFATKRPLCGHSRDGMAQFDTHEAQVF